MGRERVAASATTVGTSVESAHALGGGSGATNGIVGGFAAIAAVGVAALAAGRAPTVPPLPAERHSRRHGQYHCTT